MDPLSLPAETLYVGLEHIESDTGVWSPSTIEASEVVSAKRCFSPGDVLYGRLRPYLNKVVLATEAGVCSTDIMVLRPSAELSAEWIAAFMRTQAFVSLTTELVRGARMPRLAPDKLMELPVPFGPATARERVTSLLRTAERLRERSAETDALCARLLNAAIESALPSPTQIARGWSSAPLRELLEHFRLGAHPSTVQLGGTMRITKIETISGGRLDPDRTLLCTPTDEQVHKFLLEDEDILLNRVHSREHVGNSAMYRADMGPLLVDLNLMVLRVDRSRVSPHYLAAYLQSERIRALLRRRAKPAVNQASVNMTDVGTLEVLLPPEDVERRIVAVAERSEACRAASERLRRVAALLSRSTSAHALRGEYDGAAA